MTPNFQDRCSGASSP